MRFIHDNLYPLFAALVVVAAVSCWFAVRAPTYAALAPASAEPWVLPKSADFDSKKSIEIIAARNLWGIVPAGTTLVKPPEWRVQGIASSGSERFVLLAYEGKPFEMLKVGDSLPDGSKIAQIEKDRFFILTPDKQKIAFGIFKNDPAK